MSFYETCIFSAAHANLQLHPVRNEKRTIRVFFQTNIKSRTIQVVLSNRYGDEPLFIGGITIGFCSEDGEINEITDIMNLRYEGAKSFQIPSGEEIKTDKITFVTEIEKYIAINIYYPENTKVISGNLLGDFTLRSAKEQDYTQKTTIQVRKVVKRLSNMFLPADLVTPLTTIKEVLVETEEKVNLLACFGDSLTQQGTWVTPLREKLYTAMKGKISVCNLGIGGNRLCADSPEFAMGIYGEAGVKRFRHSLLTLSGLSHVIIALGTNDIGLPGKDGISENELIDLEDYIKAQTYIVKEIKKKDESIKIYAATIIPRRIHPPYTEEREALRNAINDWIRGTDIFDAVLDYDKFAYADWENKILKDRWYIIDGLHLSEKGGKEISEMIPIELFS